MRPRFIVNSIIVIVAAVAVDGCMGNPMEFKVDSRVPLSPSAIDIAGARDKDFPLWELNGPANVMVKWGGSVSVTIRASKIYAHGSEDGTHLRAFELQTEAMTVKQAINFVSDVGSQLGATKSDLTTFSRDVDQDPDRSRFLNLRDQEFADISIGTLQSFIPDRPVTVQVKLMWQASGTDAK